MISYIFLNKALDIVYKIVYDNNEQKAQKIYTLRMCFRIFNVKERS